MTNKEEKQLYYNTFRTVLGRGSILTASAIKTAADSNDDTDKAPATPAQAAGTPAPVKPAAPATPAQAPATAAPAHATPAQAPAAEKKPTWREENEKWFDSWMGKGNGQYGQWGMFGLGGGALLGLISEALSNKEKKNYLSSMLMHGLLGSMLTAGGRALYAAPNPSAATTAGVAAANGANTRS